LFYFFTFTEERQKKLSAYFEGDKNLAQFE